MTREVGGHARVRAVALLACVLALNSADASAVGAAAGPLKQALHIDFTELGLLVSLPALAGAVATLPVGALTDRVRRTWLLAGSLLLWTGAMLTSGAASSYEMLLIASVALGAVTATSGPTVASLTGDFFPSHERGRIYSFILTGELVGSVIGLFISGNAAGLLSWRFAFWVLAIPSAVLAWAIYRWLPEPARGGQNPLQPDALVRGEGTDTVRGLHGPTEPRGPRTRKAAGAQSLASLLSNQHVSPRPDLVLRRDPSRMSLWQAVRYVLRVRTNLALIVASALGYFFESGVRTFSVIFVSHQYAVSQAIATSLLGALAVGAIAGVLLAGHLADGLVAGGRISGRLVVAAGGLILASILFLPPLLSRSLTIAIPFLLLATAALSAPNPPLDAARLDVMPSGLWGRAEGVRTVLRASAQAIAPLLFGFISDQLTKPGEPGSQNTSLGQHAQFGGLRDTFLIMLVPLAISGVILLKARRGYQRDVATAIASERVSQLSPTSL